jgi:hypothetical protein
MRDGRNRQQSRDTLRVLKMSSYSTTQGIGEDKIREAFDTMFMEEIVEEKDNVTHTACVTDKLGDMTRFVASNTELSLDGK